MASLMLRQRAVGAALIALRRSSCGDLRSLQSFSSTKPMPAFWPPPLKLKPATVNIDFDRSLLVVEEIVLDLISALHGALPWWHPTGVCTSMNRNPWSSSGR